MMEFKTMATGLRFPEGPVAMSDGSVLLVEMNRQTLTRVTPDGKVEVVADIPGGPNGAAIGPDGHCYICNNGGFDWVESYGFTVPGHAGKTYVGGSIQRVELATGKVETLFTEFEGRRFKGPNDIVFDKQGGFWFTDHGKSHEECDDVGGVYYVPPGCASLSRQVWPKRHPNGVGLSPAEDALYVAETFAGRLFRYPVTAPGKADVTMGLLADSCMLQSASDYRLYDSLAVEECGNICVGSIVEGGIVVISPQGELVETVKLPDPIVTNICFGGPDMKTAFIVFSATGQLVAMDWPRAGLRLLHQR